MAQIAVRFEGTISPTANPARFEFGDKADPATRKTLAALYEAGHFIVVVTAFARVTDPTMAARVQTWLIEQDIAFHDLWFDFGFPDCDVYIDAAAQKPGKVKVPDATPTE